MSWGMATHYQHGIAAADELVRRDQQFCFNRGWFPDPDGNEVMQLIACAECKPLRHRLHAFAISRADQPGN